MPGSSTIPEAGADLAPAHAPFLALRYRDFRLFQAGQLLSTIGLQMQPVAVGRQVYARAARVVRSGSGRSSA
jgi:hypothetical protein